MEVKERTVSQKNKAGRGEGSLSAEWSNKGCPPGGLYPALVLAISSLHLENWV